MGKHKIIAVRHLTEPAFVVRMERKGLKFQSGQFIIVKTGNSVEQREYSVYSGEGEDFLEILVREVTGGKISRKLKLLKPGDQLEVDGPFGFFKFNPELFATRKFLFIATGTGISPFHSFVKTYPELDYHLIHGVRYGSEAYDHADFDKSKVTLCTTGDDKGDFYGRLTDYLFLNRIEPDANCFLCGNSEMIHETFDILTGKGVPVSNIYSEVYF